MIGIPHWYDVHMYIQHVDTDVYLYTCAFCQIRCTFLLWGERGPYIKDSRHLGSILGPLL